MECLLIDEIVRRSDQGVTRPFICRAEDGCLYFAKGKGAGKESRIAEYVCGCLAKIFGLPVADFAIADVSETLIDVTPIEDIHDLGAGLVFASKAVAQVQEIQIQQLAKIDEQLKKDILIFDWWVNNGDRTLSEKGGNPNLLWDNDNKNLVVIDFNMAFESDFNPSYFLENHIFAELFSEISGDMFERRQYEDRLSQAFEEFDDICNNIPSEWWGIEDGVPSKLQRETIRNTLNRIHQDTFWSAIP